MRVNGETILNCNNCESRHIEIVEQNGELMVRGTGRIYFGRVVLQLLNDKNDVQNSFENLEEKYSGMEKIIFVQENSIDVCQFEFNLNP